MLGTAAYLSPEQAAGRGGRPAVRPLLARRLRLPVPDRAAAARVRVADRARAQAAERAGRADHRLPRRRAARARPRDPRRARARPERALRDRARDGRRARGRATAARTPTRRARSTSTELRDGADDRRDAGAAARQHDVPAAAGAPADAADRHAAAGPPPRRAASGERGAAQRAQLGRDRSPALLALLLAAVGDLPGAGPGQRRRTRSARATSPSRPSSSRHFIQDHSE